MIEQAKSPARGAFASLFGVITLLFGASGVFGELRSALNKMWDVDTQGEDGLLGIVKQRFFSFGMVLAIRPRRIDGFWPRPRATRRRSPSPTGRAIKRPLPRPSLCRPNAGRLSSTARPDESNASPCRMKKTRCPAACSGRIRRAGKGRLSS
jgi:hypothetical protein